MTAPDRTDPPDLPEQPDQAAQPEAEWRRKRRLTEVFGDGLPDTTGDERDPEDRSARSAERGDTWLKEQVPPHHG